MVGPGLQSKLAFWMLIEQQTKDFIKFLSLVVILYLGKICSHECSRLVWLNRPVTRLLYHIHLTRQGQFHGERNVLGSHQSVFWVRELRSPQPFGRTDNAQGHPLSDSYV